MHFSLWVGDLFVIGLWDAPSARFWMPCYFLLLEFCGVDKMVVGGIIYSMKTSAVGMRVGGEVAKASKPFVLRVWFEKVAKFVDDLVVKYYYKGERLRPEIMAELEREDEEERQGKSVYSPAFTNADDMIAWLDSKKK